MRRELGMHSRPQCVLWLFVGLTIGLWYLVCPSVHAQWSSLETQHFRVFYTEDSHTAQRLARICEQFHGEVTSRLGPIQPEPLIDVWLSESEQHFRTTVDAPIQDWAVACAYPAQRRIVLQRPSVFSTLKLNFDTTVKHELIHVVLGQRARPVLDTVPRWFSEGVAMRLSEEWSMVHRWRLLGNSLWKRLLPLETLRRRFPVGAAQAHLAYTESFAAVAYLDDMGKGTPLRPIVDRMAAGRPFEIALRDVLGMELHDFEQSFEQYARRRYHWLPIFSSSFIFWVGVAIIVILVYYRRKQAQRQALEQWHEEEVKVDPFFQ